MFWHLHALVWGIRRSDLSDLLKDFEASGRYVAIAEGFKGVHAEENQARRSAQRSLATC